MSDALRIAGISAPFGVVASDPGPILDGERDDRALRLAFTPLQEARLRQIIAEEIDRQARRERDYVEARASGALPYDGDQDFDSPLGEMLSRLGAMITSSAHPPTGGEHG